MSIEDSLELKLLEQETKHLRKAMEHLEEAYKELLDQKQSEWSDYYGKPVEANTWYLAACYNGANTEYLAIRANDNGLFSAPPPAMYQYKKLDIT